MPTRVALRLLALPLAFAVAGCAGPAESTLPGTIPIELHPPMEVDAAVLEEAAAVLATRAAEMGLDVGVRTDADGVILEVRRDLDVEVVADLLLLPGRVWLAAVPPDVEPPAGGGRADARWPIILDGRAIDPAATMVEANPVDGQPTIEIALLPDAAEIFAAWTTEHIGESIAVVLDGTVLTAPMVVEPILDGRIAIQRGPPGFDANEARRIVAILKSGPLGLDLRP
jgi:hypothetical protein